MSSRYMTTLRDHRSTTSAHENIVSRMNQGTGCEELSTSYKADRLLGLQIICKIVLNNDRISDNAFNALRRQLLA
jgi:hypothetical protein